jgi:hypothetical protein
VTHEVHARVVRELRHQRAELSRDTSYALSWSMGEAGHLGARVVFEGFAHRSEDARAGHEAVNEHHDVVAFAYSLRNAEREIERREHDLA